MRSFWFVTSKCKSWSGTIVQHMTRTDDWHIPPRLFCPGHDSNSLWKVAASRSAEIQHITLFTSTWISHWGGPVREQGTNILNPNGWISELLWLTDANSCIQLYDVITCCQRARYINCTFTCSLSYGLVWTYDPLFFFLMTSGWYDNALYPFGICAHSY